MTIDELADAWRANNAINLELLDLCPDDTFEFKPGKGKTIRSNFVHIIGFRRAWIETHTPGEEESIEKLDWKSATREQLVLGLNTSSALMIELLPKMESSKKWTVPLFFAYAVAHEANHRSQIEIALRLNGREPDNAILYRLWEWSKK